MKPHVTCLAVCRVVSHLFAVVSRSTNTSAGMSTLLLMMRGAWQGLFAYLVMKECGLSEHTGRLSGGANAWCAWCCFWVPLPPSQTIRLPQQPPAVVSYPLAAVRPKRRAKGRSLTCPPALLSGEPQPNLPLPSGSGHVSDHSMDTMRHSLEQAVWRGPTPHAARLFEHGSACVCAM